MIYRKTLALVFLWLVTAIPAVRAFQAEGPLAVRTRQPAIAPPESGSRGAIQIRSTVSLVTIPVHVTTPFGLSVTTLTRDNFQLFEDNVQQKIVSFTKDDAPLSIGLLFDCSGSMRNKMRLSADAVTAFFKTANANDEFFLVQFNERPKLTTPFTKDADDISHEIGRTKPFGRTSLLDAIHLALREMKTAKNRRKALVIVSDGGDNRSRHTAGQIKNAMAESEVQLYAIGIFDNDADSKKQTIEEQNGPMLLNTLAEMTGGRHFPVSNLEELPSIGQRIGIELRNQYLLGYTSTNSKFDGKYRTVKLTVAAPKENTPLRAEYRHGYYAPVE
jgi:Ca-activated chloride channel family protein